MVELGGLEQVAFLRRNAREFGRASRGASASASLRVAVAADTRGEEGGVATTRSSSSAGEFWDFACAAL